MSGAQILLVAAVVVVPLAVAVVVTLWTLEPAAQRAERAKRGRKKVQTAGGDRGSDAQGRSDSAVAKESTERDARMPDSP